VTVSVTRPAAAPSNALVQLQFGATQNAAVEIGGQVWPNGSFAESFAPGTQQATFTVRRRVPGQPATVPLTVVDACGSWQTFVGGGPSAF
jgi:hypothetical protein